MTPRTLGVFFILAFGLTWGIAALLILLTEPIEALFGELGYTNPLFILAVYSPGFAGVFLVWWHDGAAGVVRFFQRLTVVRMPAGWWLLLLLGIPGAFYLGAAIKGNLGQPFPFSPWYGVLPGLAVALFIGPIEELGWRGLALPIAEPDRRELARPQSESLCESHSPHSDRQERRRGPDRRCEMCRPRVSSLSP